MRHAIVEAKTKKVVNVIVWEGAEFLPPRGHLVVRSDKCDIGDTYDEVNNSFLKEQKEQE